MRSFLDPEKWIPAVGSFDNKVYTVPVETLVEKKTADGKETREVLSVIKYKFGLLMEEEDYLVRRGSAMRPSGKVSEAHAEVFISRLHQVSTAQAD